MSERQFYELKCKRCGGQLDPDGLIYKCQSCGKTFKEQVVNDVADQLRAVLNEQKHEAVANLRQQLWAEMHTQYINSEKITDLARDIKKYLPDDYFANFCEVANNGNDRQVSHFLNNTPQSAMADYADIVLDFMLKSVTASNLNAISLFIDRAFKGDTQNYDKYMTRYEEEAQKVSSGIYELILTRDVFLAYSSADIDKVIELCDFLERNKITCFLALRNLRHGRGAVDNYDQALKTAIDNCKTVVFVSSTYSRSLTCDALTKELPYIRQKDIDGAPAEFRRAYDKMPSDYMMPRVEYLIEDYSGDVAEMMTKEFFHGIEWCKSKEAVAERIIKYLTETPKNTTKNLIEEVISEDPNAKYCKNCRTANKLNAKFCSNCGSGEFFANYNEYVSSKVKYCSVCGTQNNAEDKFCIECGSKQFVPTKKAYDELIAKMAEEERQRKIREEQERRRKEEAERKRQEEEQKRKEEQERQRKLREEQARKNGNVATNNVNSDFDIQNGVLVKYTKYDGYGNIVIPDGVKEIGKSAFGGNSSIKGITIPNSVTTISDDAFCACKSLSYINIGNAIKTIGDRAFSGCTSIERISIPNSVTFIGKHAFSFCSSLKGIILPQSVKSIGDHAFSKCTSLGSAIINNGVIGKYAFSDCGSLESVSIKNGVTAIGDGAFQGCNSLTYITIPVSVTSVGDYVFLNCGQISISCQTKKPLFSSVPKGWNSSWLGNSNASVYWGAGKH